MILCIHRTISRVCFCQSNQELCSHVMTYYQLSVTFVRVHFFQTNRILIVDKFNRTAANNIKDPNFGLARDSI